ncbi:MAG: hypothetical protein CMJ89_01640 [Planctomycetes bacterium]|jgi:hypothetical protein|nr:hypothetical protein [Planctomycetota bacterium]
MSNKENFNCPGGCGFSLAIRYDAPTDSIFRVCTNAACPNKADCTECSRPLQPLTDLRLGIRLIKDPKSRCTNNECAMFKKLVDDGWPERYAA